jgi:hypothetical protein
LPNGYRTIMLHVSDLREVALAFKVSTLSSRPVSS